MMKFQPNKKIVLELIVLLLASIVFFIIAGTYDLFEKLVEFTRAFEEYELDEFITLAIFLTICLGFFSLRRWLDLRKINKDLTRALTEIKQLKGIIPICASCKKIRDDQGYWQQVESYIARHTEDVKFSHSVCPECSVKLYQEYRQK